MPETTVAAIVTREGDPDTILLTRRNGQPFKGMWCLPGGHIDCYEAVREAVVREVQEETHLELEARFFGYFDEILPEHSIHAVVMVFCGPGRGSVRPQEAEVSEVQWCTVQQAMSLPLAFDHRTILQAYAAHRTAG